MAIEIVKRGKIPENRIYKGTCHNCKTTYKCLKSDGLFNPGDQRDGPFVTITCPVCKSTTHAYPSEEYKSTTPSWYDR